MTLAEIIGSQGSQEIAAAPYIKFHCVGDTGKSADSPEAPSQLLWQPISTAPLSHFCLYISHRTKKGLGNGCKAP